MTGRVLLTGATGFVGRHLYPALTAAGIEVRCATRDPDKAAKSYPARSWTRLDLDEPASLMPALAGCDAAVYLVHGMRSGGNYPEREARAAQAFATAAGRARLRRIVYLGGVAPPGHSSRHLQSRARAGELLRAGPVATVELRAAMIIGEGSESWRMVHDLAARLPVMVLPRWLQRSSWPVAIDDVVAAIVATLMMPGDARGCFELPGPERLTHREVLDRTAAAMGKHPRMLHVPVLTPRLSSYWIALMTGVELAMARELVEGVRYDLEPTGPSLWPELGHEPVPVDRAISNALRDTGLTMLPSSRTRQRLARVSLGAVRRSQHATNALGRDVAAR
jgi:uncharacterized protein YbjT (DUF2867 family)